MKSDPSILTAGTRMPNAMNAARFPGEKFARCLRCLKPL